MRSTGEMVWSVVGGFLGAVPLTVAGTALCTTIIGIPAGVKCIELAKNILSDN